MRVLETEVKRLQEEIAQTEEDFLGKRELLDTEIAATKAENQAFEAEIETLKTQFSEFHQSLQAPNSELSTTTRDVANLKVKINEIKSLILQQEHENAILISKVESSPPVSEKPISKTGKDEEELAKEVDIVKWRCEQLSKEQGELTWKIREYEGKLREQDELLHELSAEIPTAGSSLEAGKDEVILQERLETPKVENQALEAQFKRTKSEGREQSQTGCCHACTLC
jgi:peptidoglycan hydrolase CwlO-like protein